MAVFIAVLLGASVAALNISVIGTAMPRIAADLNGLQYYPWVFTAYLVTAAATMPIFGKLSDMYGRKRFFIGGIAVLVTGSLLAGTSQNILQLAIYRGYQGIGAGALIPISMAIVGDLFPPSEQGKWRALNQGVFTLASLLGPVIGGLTTDYLSWRWVFFLTVPVGLVAFAVTAVVMPSFRIAQQQHRVDYLGATALLLTVAPLLLAFSWAGQQYPWSSGWVIGLLTLSGAMLLVFALIELRAEEPILPLSLFRNSVFVIVTLTFFLIGLGVFGSIIYLPLFIQAVGGQTATNSGLALMPMTIVSFFAGIIAGQVLSRWGRYRILALFCTGVGALGMFLLSRMGVETSIHTIALTLVTMGVNVGIAWPLFTIVAQNALPQGMGGVAASSVAFSRNLGGTIGVAIMGTVVSSRFASGLTDNLTDQTAKIIQTVKADLISSPQALLDPKTVANLETALEKAGGADMTQQVLEGMRVSLTSAVDAALLFGAIALGIAFVSCVFLREIPLRRSSMVKEVTKGLSST